MKVIICGYNWIGCYALKNFLEDKNNEVFVFTHPSKDQDVDLIEYCESLNIKYSIDNINNSILPFEPDLIFSAYYKYIINEEIIKKVNGNIFNVHPSLLPDYKGCSSLTWAMINGEKEVGFTYHYIDSSIDTGNIILQKKIDIYEWDSQETLYLRVMFEASKYLNEVVDLVLSNYEGLAQPKGGRYFERGCPHEGQINENWSQSKVKRFIKAMNYSPRSLAKFNNAEISSYKDYLKAKK